MADVLNRTPDDLQNGTCAACGKRRYASRRDARKAAKALHPADHLTPYRCGDYWHLGHARRNA